jgi:hypothetical protein
MEEGSRKTKIKMARWYGEWSELFGCQERQRRRADHRFAWALILKEAFGKL